MKNGDQRSPAWIARQLKKYHRDNDVLKDILLLVGSLEPEVSLDEIATWTDEQCLLAQDWAGAVHLRASDNNNRVPAVPEHLKPYDRRYPQRQAQEAARDAIQAMRDDNGVAFEPTAEQWARLAGGMQRMQAAGCFFTDAEIELFGAGEHTELLSHFSKFDGFDVAHRAMNDIFEEPQENHGRNA